MDRKASDIVGLPVLTYDRGTKIYEVEDLLLDPARRQVLALLVREAALFHSARAVPFGRVRSIGVDAVIVQDSRAVIEVNRDPVLKTLYKDNVNVRQWRVMTESGRKLGNVTDMLIDSHTGEIKGLSVGTGVAPTPETIRWLPLDHATGMGQLIVYVPDSYADEFEAQQGGWMAVLATGKYAKRDVQGEGDMVLVHAGEQVTPDTVALAASQNKLSELLEAVGEEPGSGTIHAMRKGVRSGWDRVRGEGSELSRTLSATYNSIVGKTDERMRESRIRNALGRPVTRVILDPDDNIILNTGEIITHAAVDAARRAGMLDVLLSSVYVVPPKLGQEQLRYAPAARTPGEEQHATAADPGKRRSRVPLASPGTASIPDPAERSREELADSNPATTDGGFGPVSDS